MQKVLVSLGVCIALGIHLNAQSPQEAKPSFDCAKATTKVEKMICSDSSGKLQRLDATMSLNYKAIKKQIATSGKKKLLSSQKLWLEQLQQCKTKECVKESLQNRIIKLTSMSWEGRYSFSIGTDNPIDLSGTRMQSFTFLDCKNDVCVAEYNALRNYATCEIERNSNLLSLQIRSHNEATLFLKHDINDKGCTVSLVKSNQGFEVRNSSKAIEECNIKEFESCGYGTMPDWQKEFVRENN